MLGIAAFYAERYTIRSELRRGIHQDHKFTQLPLSAPFYFNQCTSDKDAAEMQRSVLKDTEAKCDDQGLCSCPLGKQFDGLSCKTVSGSAWENPWKTLNKKWTELPGAQEFYIRDKVVRIISSFNIVSSIDLLSLADSELETFWDKTASQDSFTMYYASIFRGKKVLDIGSGLARQTMQFAIHGANVTFVDLSKDTLKILKRLAKIKGCENRVNFIHMKNLESLNHELQNHPLIRAGGKFDVITAFGSMHHAPSEIIAKEASMLLDHLIIGGRWLQLAYPVTRWKNSQPGKSPLSFEYFGKITDSENTPWSEWYSPGKLKSLLQKTGANFIVNWCGTVASDEFIWMELTYLGKNPKQTVQELTEQTKIASQ